MVGHDHARLDLGGAAGRRSSCRTPSDLRGMRLGDPRGAARWRRGDRAGRACARLRGDARAGRGRSAPRVETCRLPHAPHALSAYYMIAPAEASRQPRALRRRALRLLRVERRRRPRRRCTARTRGEGFGAEVKRRIMLGTYALSSGYYDAYYGQRSEGAHEDRRGLRAPPSRRSTSSSPRPRRTSPSSSGRRPTTRWRCTSTTSAPCRCRSPGSRRSRSPAG